MIPKTNGALEAGVSFTRPPSKTIRLDFEKERLVGFTDGLDSVRQAVYVILSVERYDYLIHSWNFGSELKTLFGRPMNWVIPEAKRRIREALMRDDRITDVDSFLMTPERHTLHAAFTVRSIYGDFNEEMKISV